MTYENLGEFIHLLETKQELLRIKVPVSPCLEITEIADRISKSEGGGKALLFEKVEGSSFPLLINAFGSFRRIALALGADNLELPGERLREFLKTDLPHSLTDKLRLLEKAFGLARCFPRTVKISHPPCQEVIRRGREVDLLQLPLLQCWPEDGGLFITLPVVFTKSLSTGKRNAGMYRLQVFDRNTTGMHWHIHKDGAHIFREYERKGQKMEVAVAIGTDPAVTYAATAPLPPGVDEMLLAGFLRRRPVKMVPAVTVNLEVPAEAEIILEGYIDPQERRLEGPFGDHTGYYSLPDQYPVFHVTALTHRNNAVYSTTVVGRPPMEDCYLALATERLFLPLLTTLWPEICDYRLPWEGVFHNVALVSIKKEYPGQAHKVMHGLWGSGQMSFCKMLVMVDENTRLDSGSLLVMEILSRIDLQNDLIITDGILDALDHSAPQPFFGGKLGVDATRRVAGEPQRPEATDDQSGSSPAAIAENIKALDPGFTACRILFPDLALPLALINIRKTEQKRGTYFRDLLFSNDGARVGIAVFYDDDVDIRDDSLLLWKAFNNVDPRRDISLRGRFMVIDATRKSALDGHPRPWPDDLINSTDIKRLVSDRWQEYGILADNR